jgi:ABC-2 type transport system permease protein
MKVYPGFGYLLVLIVMMTFQSKSLSISDFSEMTEHGKSIFLVVIYFSSFIFITAIGQLAYSEKYKAAWLFAICPLDTPGKILSGAVKSVMVSFYIPILLIFALFGVVFGGPVIIPNLILGCFNVLTIGSLIAFFNLKQLPFSVSPQNAPKGRTMNRNFISMLIPGFLGILHWFIFDYIWAVMILAVLSVIATWMVMDSIRNLSWAKIGNFNTNH